MTEAECPKCHGKRLKDEVLAVTVGGINIAQLSDMSVAEAYDFIDNLTLSEKDAAIARQIVKEIKSRLSFLIDVGLLLMWGWTI